MPRSASRASGKMTISELSSGLNYLLFVSVVVITTGLDRAAKIAACKYLSLGRSIPAIPGIFHITLVFNKGAAFGLFQGGEVLFVSAAAIVIVLGAAFLIIKRPSEAGIYLISGLFIGGAIGNLFDRIAYGAVIDFIDLRVWPVFNIADSAITVGAVLLGWRALFGGESTSQK